jgi:uncharacterized protein (TIGR02391 family)
MVPDKFNNQILQGICNVLADTRDGLTGGEISRLFQGCGIIDTNPGITKRHRLFSALKQRQDRDGYGTAVVQFILAAMNPVSYVEDRDKFQLRKSKLNLVLTFNGLILKDDGKLYKTSSVTTIDEAHEKASRLRKGLMERKVHADVLKFCRAELLQDNYFHAVFEATKSVADKIRELSGFTSDGSDLVDEAFGLGKKAYPVLAFNSLQTETEQGEHKGLMNLIKGIFGVFRNTTAHVPKIKWDINEADCLDILTLASMIHRRLDKVVKTRGSVGTLGGSN